MTKNSFLWIHYGAQSLAYSLLNTSTSFSPLRSHGAGKYNVSCGPIFQYLPRLWPLTKHTPLVQLFICKKVSLGSPVTPNVPRYIEGMVGNSPSLIFLHSDRVLNLRYKKTNWNKLCQPLEIILHHVLKKCDSLTGIHNFFSAKFRAKITELDFGQGELSIEDLVKDEIRWYALLLKLKRMFQKM